MVMHADHILTAAKVSISLDTSSNDNIDRSNNSKEDSGYDSSAIYKTLSLLYLCIREGSGVGSKRQVSQLYCHSIKFNFLHKNVLW